MSDKYNTNPFPGIHRSLPLPEIIILNSYDPELQSVPRQTFSSVSQLSNFFDSGLQFPGATVGYFAREIGEFGNHVNVYKSDFDWAKQPVQRFLEEYKETYEGAEPVTNYFLHQRGRVYITKDSMQPFWDYTGETPSLPNESVAFQSYFHENNTRGKLRYYSALVINAERYINQEPETAMPDSPMKVGRNIVAHELAHGVDSEPNVIHGIRTFPIGLHSLSTLFMICYFLDIMLHPEESITENFQRLYGADYKPLKHPREVLSSAVENMLDPSTPQTTMMEYIKKVMLPFTELLMEIENKEIARYPRMPHTLSHMPIAEQKKESILSWINQSEHVYFDEALLDRMERFIMQYMNATEIIHAEPGYMSIRELMAGDIESFTKQDIENIRSNLDDIFTHIQQIFGPRSASMINIYEPPKGFER